MLHKDLPIYKTGTDLLAVAYSLQRDMPRGFKRTLGEKIVQGCTDMLELMAVANATRHAQRAAAIEQLLVRLRATEVTLRVALSLRAPHYVRYVDDFVLVHSNARWLSAALKSIEEKLAELHLALNPRKTILQPVARGVDFAGHLIKPWRRTLRARTFDAALERVGAMPACDLHQGANSYFGLLRQASHSHADRARLARLVLARGRCVNAAFTKSFRSRTN
jgi:hypothetical protein